MQKEKKSAKPGTQAPISSSCGRFVVVYRSDIAQYANCQLARVCLSRCLIAVREVNAEMLSVESLQVAEEEVVESGSNKLCDIYTFVAKGCFPQTMNPLRKKNLKRYAQKFIIEGKRLNCNVYVM